MAKKEPKADQNPVQPEAAAPEATENTPATPTQAAAPAPAAGPATPSWARTAPAPVPATDPSLVPNMVIVAEASGRTDEHSRELLFEACERFGVNPSVHCRPRELGGWRFYPGNEYDGIPDSVVFVTMGGLKVRHWADPDYPMDEDTEELLRNAFQAFRINEKKERVPVPLPDSLILPEVTVTGIVNSQRHVYRGGYLRAGGKAEADRREAAARKK